MEPGVPFALLGAVQLLLIGAFLGLALATLWRRSVPGGLVAFGAVVLAAIEVRTALRLGVPSSDDLALARAAACLVVGAGFYTGGLGRRRGTPEMYGVVVPLAAAGGPAAFAAAASAVAGLAAIWNRRDAVGAWVAAGFGLFAAAAVVAPMADTGAGAPVAVLILRGLGGIAVLVALALLAQVSLLAKVVGAILVGVLAMAIAAVGVVGTVVVSSYDTQNRDLVVEARDSRLAALQQNAYQTANQLALVAPLACVPSGGQSAADRCLAALAAFAPSYLDDFVVRVPQVGSPVALAGRVNGKKVLPTRSEVLGLRSLTMVTGVLGGSGAGRVDSVVGPARLAGSPPSVAIIAVVPVRQAGQKLPVAAFIYGIRIDDNYARRDLDPGQSYALSLLAGDPLQVVASNASVRQGRELLALVRAAGADRGVPADGLVLASQGSQPTIALKPIRDADPNNPQTVALLAVSRDAGPALDAERRALQLLLVTALLALIAVAVAAAILGRRTVDPVRRLTAAAARVAAGDLTTTSAVSGRDEVGTLSRTFDGMTASLAQLTGDLRSSAVHLATVLASMSDGLLATDADGIVTSVNRAALGMLGLEEQDVVGESLDIVADVRDPKGMHLADVALRLRDEPAEVRRPDGSTVPVRVTITPLEGLAGVVLVLRDTTREREVERMKTEFLSNVSHELRTPLTPIRGYAEILVGKPGMDSEKVTLFATTIRDESIKMNRVVDLLVDVAALEAGRVSVSPRPVTVKELLDVRLDLWQSRVPGRKADFKRRVAAGLPAVLVDPTWVGKALDEFLDNAVKYTPSGTAITLVGSWSPDGSRVRVAVRDAGPGIAEGDQGGLFTSFEQVDGSATRRVGGLGLGLSFVQRLAEDAGYPLSVTSRLGKGAEFALDLPVSDEQPPRRKK
jgi:PAS domain S-box-containing protein